MAKKVKQLPSETYAARVARGRRPIVLGLPESLITRLDELAGYRGESRANVVAEALERLFAAATAPLPPEPAPAPKARAKAAPSAKAAAR